METMKRCHWCGREYPKETFVKARGVCPNPSCSVRNMDIAMECRIEAERIIDEPETKKGTVVHQQWIGFSGAHGRIAEDPDGDKYIQFSPNGGRTWGAKLYPVPEDHSRELSSLEPSDFSTEKPDPLERYPFSDGIQYQRLRYGENPKLGDIYKPNLLHRNFRHNYHFARAVWWDTTRDIWYSIDGKHWVTSEEATCKPRGKIQNGIPARQDKTKLPKVFANCTLSPGIAKLLDNHGGVIREKKTYVRAGYCRNYQHAREVVLGDGGIDIWYSPDGIDWVTTHEAIFNVGDYERSRPLPIQSDLPTEPKQKPFDTTIRPTLKELTENYYNNTEPNLMVKPGGAARAGIRDAVIFPLLKWLIKQSEAKRASVSHLTKSELYQIMEAYEKEEL